MGSCLSKKGSTTTSTSSYALTTAAVISAPPPDPNKCGAQVEKKKVEAEEENVKKEIFVIKHRKSHDKRPEEKKGGVTCRSETHQICSKTTTATTSITNTALACNNNVVTNGDEGGGGSSMDIAAAAAPVRTSSCTKEEVDAILIQCGRLSRSSSGKATSGGRKYSGSKRSFDFDHHDTDVGNGDEDDRKKGNNAIEDNDDEMAEKRHHRQRHRQSRALSHERRRTPSREREQQRSGSRDRGSSGGGGGANGSGRRVSRSPGRRSETSHSTTSTNGATTPATATASGNHTTSSRPGKMVSVPATVSSLAMDKSNNGGGGAETATTTAIKRVSVKRNVGEAVPNSRSAASPRSQSPAKTNNANAKLSSENQNAHSCQQPSLSRSSSRKAERSPYRRTPLNEVDTNSLVFQQPPSNKTASNFVTQAPMQKPDVEEMHNRKVVIQGTNVENSSRGTQENKAVTVSSRVMKQQQHQISEAPPIEPKGQQPKTSFVEVTAVASGAESLKPQTLTRSRSSRRSRDLDINPETLLNPTASYTTLLLEDIQSFHQKSNNPSFSLPACVTKACSILEAVADLNSCTSSNLSCTFSEDRKSPSLDQSNKNFNNFSYGTNLAGQKELEAKDPFVESELGNGDDIMEPSLHKYVTVRRGTVGGGGEMEEQESSGSNSFISGQQHWEPNSSDSTDCWTSRSNTREGDLSPLGFPRHALSESGGDADGARRRLSAKKRDSGNQQAGIGITRGRVGASRGLHTLTSVAAAAST
ncbi:hypothetical protein L1049_023755 [Liquidambar formosana]|uniref:Uncharacterized protein n=1 Tax=Liquidambar formosana TaxID=63359 RepID=A0AAP0RV06_LIQFO